MRLAIPAIALALAAGPARAADPQPEPDALSSEAPAAEDQASWEIAGRLRGRPDGLSLELGGALVELRISRDELSASELPGADDPRARDFRASFSVDGETTNLLLRIVPPPGDEPPAAPE